MRIRYRITATVEIPEDKLGEHYRTTDHTEIIGIEEDNAEEDFDAVVETLLSAPHMDVDISEVK